jgi:Tol biopolymer transport system component
MFRSHLSVVGITNRFFIVDANGGEPREILAEFLSNNHLISDSAAWHPDAKRITVLACCVDGVHPGIWTVNLTDGKAVQSQTSSEAAAQFAGASSPGAVELTAAAKLSWLPSGDAVYFDHIYRGARNLWKLAMDPPTLAVISAERLTTGVGPDSQPDVSPDGHRLAFTAQHREVRTWLFPFDAAAGKITGSGKAVTPSSIASWLPNVSRDGKKLAYRALFGERQELWQKVLPNGPETQVPGAASFDAFPVWSPDATRLVYRSVSPEDGKGQLVVWSALTGEEQRFGPRVDRGLDIEPYDWSPDGKSILASIENSHTHSVDIWKILVATPTPPSNLNPQKIISGLDYSLYQGHFSPDGRWIVFIGCRNGNSIECTVFAAPSAGGVWARLSDGHFFDDKPRWAPDGKTVYYVSGRAGLYNVRGIRFDPASGRRSGESFAVTSFRPPGPLISDNITAVELSLTQTSLVITLEESPGSIWVLDHLDR